MTYDAIPILVGLPVGALIWWVTLRPMALREHERKRRAAGLPPERRLPEDA